MSNPATTKGLDKSKVTFTPSNADPLTVEKYLISSVYAANNTKAPSLQNQ